MVKVYPIIGALVTLVALILLAIGCSTNYWVHLERTEDGVNPVVVNNKLANLHTKALGETTSTTDISYSVTHFGLWIGCHKEHSNVITCAYIGVKCHSNVCWIRKTPSSRDTTCQDERFLPIPNCVACQFVRAFVVLGLFLLVCGLCVQIVSLITAKRSLAMLAGLIIFGAGLFNMIAFAIFYSENWVKAGLTGLGRTGYSLHLIIASWPLAMVGGVISCCAASMGLRHKEVSDYSASNY